MVRARSVFGGALGTKAAGEVATAAHAFWFNPRSGKWRVEATEFAQQTPFSRNIPSGNRASDHMFPPPGGEQDGNDWVLVLVAK